MNWRTWTTDSDYRVGMSNPTWPIPVPRERIGATGEDPADTGPTVPGDQKMNPDGSFFSSHNGRARDIPQTRFGSPLTDPYVWKEE